MLLKRPLIVTLRLLAAAVALSLAGCVVVPDDGGYGDHHEHHWHDHDHDRDWR